MSLYSRDGFDRGLSIPEYIAKPFWSISYDLRPIDLDSGSLLGDLYDRSVTALEGETLTFKVTRKLYLYNQYRNGSTTKAFRKNMIALRITII